MKLLGLNRVELLVHDPDQAERDLSALRLDGEPPDRASGADQHDARAMGTVGRAPQPLERVELGEEGVCGPDG